MASESAMLADVHPIVILNKSRTFGDVLGAGEK